MRKILLLFCISCVTISVKSQTVGDSEKTWNEGYYYDLNGIKVTGSIDRNHGAGKSPVKAEDFFRFRKDKDAKKVILSTSMVKSFVCGPDSFTVSNSAIPKRKVFLRVLIDEPVKLYEYDRLTNSGGFMSGGGGMMMMGGGGPMTDIKLLFGVDPNNVVQLKSKNFKDAMTSILVNREALLAKINSKDFEYEDIEDIINYYNGMKLEEARTKN